ncbi:MAG: DUF302 domain-containing protein [Rhodospirillaceae bacterium]|nr:DUF302 domain-containing protein [Rhodospirillaceae bacterium]
MGASAAMAQGMADTPYEDMIVIPTEHDFDTLWDRMEAAVTGHEMLLVGRASASRGAAGRGIDIPGNGVIDVYRNDFAVRMLEASVAAGFEAPIRYYLTEGEDGTATLSYRPPSAVFAPYGNAALDEMAAELDAIFAAIAADATAAP